MELERPVQIEKSNNTRTEKKKKETRNKNFNVWCTTKSLVSQNWSFFVRDFAILLAEDVHKVYKASETKSNVFKRASVFKCFCGLSNERRSDCCIGQF